MMDLDNKPSVDAQSSSGDDVSQQDLDAIAKLYLGYNGKGMYAFLHESYSDLIEYLIPYFVREHVLYKHEDTMYAVCIDNVEVKLPADEYDKSIITPAIARDRNLTYACSIFGDLRIRMTDPRTGVRYGSAQKILITKLPVMVQSRYCTLTSYPCSRARDECESDHGGYFIINGSEKVVVSLERQVTNKLIFFTKEGNYYACMNTQQNSTKSIQQISVIYNSKKKALFFVSNMFSSAVPLVSVLKTLGMRDERVLYGMITRGLSDSLTTNAVINSVALATATTETLSGKLSPSFRSSSASTASADDKMVSVYSTYLLAGTAGMKNKAKYLCHMANRLLYNIEFKEDVFRDRDSYENKRFDTAGILIGSLFKQAWQKVMRDASITFIKKKNFEKDLESISIAECMKPAYIEQFIKVILKNNNKGMLCARARVCVKKNHANQKTTQKSTDEHGDRQLGHVADEEGSVARF